MVNSKQKGNRAERELAKILTKRFGIPFARNGNWTAVTRETIADINVPKNFAFGTIEVKSRKDPVNYLMENKELDAMLSQAERDAKAKGDKPPLLCIKVNRRGWDVVVPIRAFPHCSYNCNFYTRYRNYLVYRLETLLLFTYKHFWFTP